MEQWIEYFGEKFSDHPVFFMIVFIVILLIFATIFVKVEQKFNNWRYERRKRKELDELRVSEQAKINQLPVIRKGYLLKHEGKVCLGSIRSFGSRYDSIVVYDEFGQLWYGRRTPELMDDLIAAQYTLEDYWIPFCGPGEMYRGKVVEVGGKLFDNYPTYLFGKSVTGPEWAQWKKVEMNYTISRQEKRRPKKYSDYVDYRTSEAWARTKRQVGPLVPQT